MRLIDAEQTKLMLSELLEVAEKENFTAEDAIEHACVWIDGLPTAYDTEKVVEEVQNIHLPLASQTVRIIGIVRKGGVE